MIGGGEGRLPGRRESSEGRYVNEHDDLKPLQVAIKR